jgi:hypothetical protein
MEGPVPGLPGNPINDITFNPVTGSHVYPAVFSTGDVFVAADIVAAAYVPDQRLQFAFWATQDNKIMWATWRSGNNTPADRRNIPEPNTGRVQDLSTGWSAPNSIVDMAAFYSSLDDELYVVVLMNDGEIVACHSQPWTDPTDQDWTLLGFFLRIDGAARVTAACGPDGWNHAFVATSTNVSEIYFAPGQTTGHNPIWSFPHAITDIGCYFTQADGVAHVIAASPLPSGDTLLEEITFTPAQVPPADRVLAQVSLA